jgi:hypothetical protein
MLNRSNIPNDEWPVIRKTRHSGYSTFLILISIFLPAPLMSQSAKELSKLPKEKLIEMAVSKIKEPSFRLADFTEIEVWLEDNELTVDFGHLIRFIPKRGQYYYSVSVDLISGSTGRSIQGRGPDDVELTFYDPKKYQDEIKFVFNAINNSDGEIGKIPEGQLPDGHMNIQEETGFYDVEVDSYSTHSYYKVKKGSGKIYDAGHKHYYRDEDLESKRKKIY